MGRRSYSEAGGAGNNLFEYGGGELRLQEGGGELHCAVVIKNIQENYWGR